MSSKIGSIEQPLPQRKANIKLRVADERLFQDC
jgi:hypothetical protein